MGGAFPKGFHRGCSLRDAVAGACRLSNGSTRCMSNTLAYGIADRVSDRIGYRRRDTASYRIGNAVCFGIRVIPPLRSAQIGHIHHRNGQAEIHTGIALKLLIPSCHLTGCLTEPTFQMLGLNGAGYDLKHVFAVGHTGNIFLGGVLGIGIDVLTTHTLITNVDTAGFCFGNASNNGQSVHCIHFLVKPLQLVVG